MAPVTEAQVEQVRALVAAIPSGRVVTYGEIAAAAGLSSPRIVGWIMRNDSADLPWHRVITASGRPARHLATRQLELLRSEGVLSVDGRIALDEVRYRFAGQSELENQPDQGRGARQTRKGRSGRTRVQRVDSEPKHQRPQ